MEIFCTFISQFNDNDSQSSALTIKLHPAVLPLLSPLGRSLSLQVQLDPIEVLIEMLMTRWWFGINTQEMPLQMPGAHRESAVVHCPVIGRNADDWAVVSVSALYGASAAAGNTRLRM